MWDEEKQEWIDRWGRGGKNKEKEGQWLSEVPANKGTSPFLFFLTLLMRRSHP